MTTEEKNKLSKIYDSTCKAFDKILDSEVLKMQIEDLSDLNFNQVVYALSKYRTDAKNNTWPRANKIREIINPTRTHETMANESASRIRKAISDYGWCDPTGARNYIGELGWQVVNRAGGWQYICENHGVLLSPLTFHAQARDLAKSICESEILGFGDQPVALPDAKNKAGINDVIKLLSEQKSLTNGSMK